MSTTNTAAASPARTGKRRRMAREPDTSRIDHAEGALSAPPAPRPPSKLDVVEQLLLMPEGASIAELVAATGWQQHSVRGAMAGALRKRGLVITSAKRDDTRRYRAERPA